MKVLNLFLFVFDNVVSNVIIVVVFLGVEVEKICSIMCKKFDIVMVGGQDYLKGKIFCIGYLGFVCDWDIFSCIGVLEVILIELGYEGVIFGFGVVVVVGVLVKG